MTAARGEGPSTAHPISGLDGDGTTDLIVGTAAGQPVQIRRVPFAGAVGFFLTCASDLVLALREVLKASGATECGSEALEIVRIEAGTPLFGVDLSEEAGWARIEAAMEEMARALLKA